MKAIPIEADGPSRQQVQDYRVRALQGRSQAFGEKGEIKEIHTLCDQIQVLTMSVQAIASCLNGSLV